MLKEKTTQVALLGMVGFIVLLVLLIMKVITASDFGIAVGAWAGAIVTLGLFYAGDRKKPE